MDVDKPFSLVTCVSVLPTTNDSWAVEFDRAYHVITGPLALRGLTKKQADQYKPGQQYWFPLPVSKYPEAPGE